jgi:hypothetical protein
LIHAWIKAKLELNIQFWPNATAHNNMASVRNISPLLFSNSPHDRGDFTKLYTNKEREKQK